MTKEITLKNAGIRISGKQAHKRNDGLTVFMDVNDPEQDVVHKKMLRRQLWKSLNLNWKSI